jgi:hypothetical protein
MEKTTTRLEINRALNDIKVSRRDYLTVFGTASLTPISVSSATAHSTVTTERHGIQFETVYDAIDDLGMDNTGTEPIDEALDKYYGDSTLITFPPGDYLVTETHYWGKNIDSFGILGCGEVRQDVQFVLPSGTNIKWLNIRNGCNHLLENFVWQQTPDMVTSFTNTIHQDDGLHIENVELAGFNPTDNEEKEHHAVGPGLLPAILTRDGVGVVKEFVCTGGGVVDLYPHRRVPIFTGSIHRGELQFVDCHIEESGSHAIYASKTQGCLRVNGGLFKNNDNTNMRITSGHPEKQSWCKNARIVIDTDNATHLPEGERYEQTRGFRFDRNRPGLDHYSNFLIENCDVVMRSTPNSNGLLVVAQSHPGLRIRRTRFQQEVDDVRIIWARSPDQDVIGDAAVHLDIETIRITGSATNGNGIYLRERPNSVIQDTCIHLTGTDRNGVRLTNADGSIVRNSRINVTGEPVILENTDAEVHNINENGSCPSS